MNAMPQPRPDRSEQAAPPASPAESNAVSLASATTTGPDAPPPHLLWATLESAYAPPEQSPLPPQEERLPLHIALPMAVGLSLVLWVIIVELVLMR